MSDWIRGADRLPNADRFYLVYDQRCGIDFVYWSNLTRAWEGATYRKTAADSGVITHWMPLPEPPDDR